MEHLIHLWIIQLPYEQHVENMYVLMLTLSHTQVFFFNNWGSQTHFLFSCLRTNPLKTRNKAHIRGWREYVSSTVWLKHSSLLPVCNFLNVIKRFSCVPCCLSHVHPSIFSVMLIWFGPGGGRHKSLGGYIRKCFRCGCDSLLKIRK